MRTTILLGALTLAFSLPLGCGDEASTPTDEQSDTDMGTVVADVTFTPLRVEELAANRAVIRFETSRPTTCEIAFGIAANALNERATDPAMEDGEYDVDHDVPLEDLLPETTYYFEAVVEDADGNTYTSDASSFTTPAAGDQPFTGPDIATVANGASIVEVSSNYGGGENDSSWGANNIIDGQMDTEWATNGDGDSAYVVLDLGSERTLVGFGFRSRVMSNGTSQITRIALSVEGASEAIGTWDTPEHTEVYLFRFETPVTATRLRLDAVGTTGGNTGAKELLLFER